MFISPVNMPLSFMGMSSGRTAFGTKTVGDVPGAVSWYWIPVVAVATGLISWMIAKNS